MASDGAGLPGGIGLRLFCSRFCRTHRSGGCRFRLADSLGRHRRRRFAGCCGLRFGANHFSRRIVARVRRGNWLRCLRRPFCLFGILRLRRFAWRRHRGGSLGVRVDAASQQITELVGLVGRRQINACCKANRAGYQRSERNCKRSARHVMQLLARMSAPLVIRVLDTTGGQRRAEIPGMTVLLRRRLALPSDFGNFSAPHRDRLVTNRLASARRLGRVAQRAPANPRKEAPSAQAGPIRAIFGLWRQSIWPRVCARKPA